MKKPQIDLHRLLTGQWLMQVSWVNKFLRHWGTEKLVCTDTSDKDYKEGYVEVLVAKHYTYPKEHLETEQNKKLYRHLQVYKKLQEINPEGVSSTWLYLNPAKSDLYTLTDEVLASRLQMDMEDVVCTITISLQNDSLGIAKSKWANLVDLKAYLITNWEQILSSYIMQVDGSTELDDDRYFRFRVLGTYALLANLEAYRGTKITASIRNIQTGLEEVQIEGLTTIVKTIVLIVDINKTGIITNTDPLVIKIANEINAVNKGEEAAQAAKEAANAGSEDMLTFADEFESFTDPKIWYMGRLRASVLQRGSCLKSKEKTKLIQDILDQGYQKKKVPMYKRLLIAVIFIAVIVISCMNGCTTTGFLLAIVKAAFAVSLTSFAMAKWGDEEGAQAGVSFTKTIDPIVKIASVVLIITGLMAAYNAAKEALVAAATKAAEEAAKTAVTEAAKAAAADALKAALTPTVSEILLKMVLSPGQKVMMTILSMATAMYYKNEIKDLREEADTLQKQIDAYNERTEDKFMRKDLALLFIESHTSPLVVDWSKYSAIYDMPYSSTLFNVQATTVEVGKSRV